MIHHQMDTVPPFAVKYTQFVHMWDGADYSPADKRSIYEATILVLLRQVWEICEHEQLTPLMLEMALVKFFGDLAALGKG